MKLLARIIGHYLNLLSYIRPKAAGRKAFEIFCTPRGGRLKEHHQAFLHTAEQGVLEFEGDMLRTYRWGNGPYRVLALHGWQSNSYHWKKVIEGSDGERFTFIAIDAPAHGASEGRYLNVPIYSRVVGLALEELGPFDALLAHSIACFASMLRLHEHPEPAPGRMILISAPGPASDFVDELRNALHLNKRANRALDAYFKEYTGKDLEYFDTVNYASSMQRPALLIHDALDEYVNIQHSESITEFWSEARLLVTEGFGHSMRDEKVAQLILGELEHSLPSPIDQL